MQGLGEGPEGVLLGTWDDGNVILLQNEKQPLTLCTGWDQLDVLAATDQIVVGGHVSDVGGPGPLGGGLRIARMDTPL